jgi:hypothetical protein
LHYSFFCQRAIHFPAKRTWQGCQILRREKIYQKHKNVKWTLTYAQWLKRTPKFSVPRSSETF